MGSAKAMFERLSWRGEGGRAVLHTVAVVGAILALLMAYRGLRLPAENWAVISLVLVFQPQAKASVRLAATRVAANLIGSGVALAALQVGGTSIPAIVVAMLVVGMLCHLLYLDEAVRTAYVSVAVIMTADRMATLSPPLDRVASVAVGSLFGVALSLLIESAERWWQRGAGAA